MSNGESGSVLGTAIVGGSTVAVGTLADTGVTSIAAIAAGVIILAATAFVTIKGRSTQK